VRPGGVVPAVPGVLTETEIRQTAASIATMQEGSGAVPLTPGGPTDLWNHVESAMALLIGGEVEAGERALRWARQQQRSDGSWPLRTVLGRVSDPSGDPNGSAYLAVGLWAHWLLRGDRDFVDEHWRAVRGGLDFAVRQQLPFGGIAWSQEWHAGQPGHVNDVALLAGSSSIYQALRAGLALAELTGDDQPGWATAAARLGHALRSHRDQFANKAAYAMDWYYPILVRAVTGVAATSRIAWGWDRFVRTGVGIICLDGEPWVTGAETCELVSAVAAHGDLAAASALFTDMQHLRAASGGYWTGLVLPDRTRWPTEHSTYTAAAVILAADAISRVTSAASIWRGQLPYPKIESVDQRSGGEEPCGCRSPDRIADMTARPA
jgi:hypothetical protein